MEQVDKRNPVPRVCTSQSIMTVWRLVLKDVKISKIARHSITMIPFASCTREELLGLTLMMVLLDLVVNVQRISVDCIFVCDVLTILRFRTMRIVFTLFAQLGKFQF